MDIWNVAFETDIKADIKSWSTTKKKKKKIKAKFKY